MATSRAAHPLDVQARAYLREHVGANENALRIKGEKVRVRRMPDGRYCTERWATNEHGKPKPVHRLVTSEAWGLGWRPKNAHEHVQVSGYRSSWSPSSLVRIDIARRNYNASLGPPLAVEREKRGHHAVHEKRVRAARAIFGALSQTTLHIKGFTCSPRFVSEITGWERGEAGAFVLWIRKHGLITKVGQISTPRSFAAFEPDAEPNSLPFATKYIATFAVAVVRAGYRAWVAGLEASYMVNLGFSVSERTKTVLVAPTLIPKLAHAPPDESKEATMTNDPTGPEQTEREVALTHLHAIRERLGSRVAQHDEEREKRRALLLGQVDDLIRPELPPSPDELRG